MAFILLLFQGFIWCLTLVIIAVLLLNWWLAEEKKRQIAQGIGWAIDEKYISDRKNEKLVSGERN
jgi:VIT1/CCC1 family predicted Fe2+/Mn2+ transporter